MKPTLLSLLGALALALLAPSAAQAAPTPSGAAGARVIVKFKADSALLRKQAASAAERHSARALALGARVGLPLAAGQGIAERTQVVFASGMSSEALAARLAKEQDVEYAVPDRRKQRAAAATDPLYAASASISPASGQWYLRPPNATLVSAINAEQAWNLSTGSANVIVAVLDTGVRTDHPDLAGKFVNGYDFVGPDRDDFGNVLSPVSYLSAKDNDGYDNDPSDEGDGITETEANTVGGLFYGCTESDGAGGYLESTSSWHGTQVSGIIGALTNNGIGMASVGRNVRVLPVRVLAKCGGWDSDILAGMRWAAGLSVPGVTDNANPAWVINMSLGGSGTCSPAYADVVRQINALGTVIVASAGNGAGLPVSEPANCEGVIGVAGLRHAGSKVGYSDMGPEVSISAPAGNCVTDTGACLYPILTTSNAGSFDPVTNAANGSIYTDAFNITIGTSFSAPLVAGTAALMLSIRPELSPTEVRRLLMNSSRLFPALQGVPMCPQMNAAGECNCTTDTCGAGMLDAASAVAAANGPIVRIGLTPAQPQAGSALTLDSLQTSVISGRTIASRQWTLVDGGGIVSPSAVSGATGDSLSLTPSAGGTFVVSLTVTDNTGMSDTQTVEVSVVNPQSSGGGALGLGWLLALAAAVAALWRGPRARAS